MIKTKPAQFFLLLIVSTLLLTGALFPGSLAHAVDTSNSTAQTIAPPIDADSIGTLIVRAVKFLLQLIGAVAVLFIIIGGFKMVMSQGSEESLKSGKKTVTWAVIGLVVALMAFSIIAVVQSVLGKN